MNGRDKGGLQKSSCIIKRLQKPSGIEYDFFNFTLPLLAILNTDAIMADGTVSQPPLFKLKLVYS